ncbi:O-antigen ligase family protein [Shewanella algae]|uniref:O-antigen ligase family protein n=1 Tax=Shewanella algae TaxID=38313 RepID=UPI001AAD3BB6|nr:O-antigen ligase family protein [Shewanella algae]MBO2600172.1 O-antigen ligase family protein [Shewanella algae]
MISSSKLFLYILFFVSPFIDAINGYLVLNGFSSEGGSGSIGQVFRLFLTIYAFYFLGVTLSSLYIFIIFIASVFVEVFFAIFHQNISGLLVGIIYANKIIFILLVYLALKKVANFYGLNIVIKFFIISACLYGALLIITTVLGISTSTYYSGMGSKGVFASGNGLSLYIGASSLVALYYLREKSILFYSVPCFLIFSSLIVGTKASLIFSSLFFLVVFNRVSMSAKFIFTVIFSLIIYFNFNYLLESFNLIFEVIVRRYNNSDSLFHFLASGRDQILALALSDFNIDGINIVRVLTGYGVFTSYRSPTSFISSFDTLESDFLDVFFMYGAIGIFIYLSVFFKSLLNSIYSKDLALVLSVLGVFGYSFIAGHVLFNAMSSLVLCIVVLITLNYKCNKS